MGSHFVMERHQFQSALVTLPFELHLAIMDACIDPRAIVALSSSCHSLAISLRSISAFKSHLELSGWDTLAIVRRAGLIQRPKFSSPWIVMARSALRKFSLTLFREMFFATTSGDFAYSKESLGRCLIFILAEIATEHDSRNFSTLSLLAEEHWDNSLVEMVTCLRFGPDSVSLYYQSFVVTAHALWLASNGVLPTQEFRTFVNAYTMGSRLELMSQSQAGAMNMLVWSQSQANHLHLTALHLFLNPADILPFMKLCTASSTLFDPLLLESVVLDQAMPEIFSWLPRTIVHWQESKQARGYRRRCVNGTPGMVVMSIDLSWDGPTHFRGIFSDAEGKYPVSGVIDPTTGSMNFRVESRDVALFDGHVTPWGLRGRFKTGTIDGFFAIWTVNGENLDIWDAVTGDGITFL